MDLPALKASIDALAEQVRVVPEELRDAPQHLLDALLLALVRVEHLEEGLVGLGLVLEPLLDRRDVRDRVVEFHLDVGRLMRRRAVFGKTRKIQPLLCAADFNETTVVTGTVTVSQRRLRRQRRARTWCRSITSRASATRSSR